MEDVKNFECAICGRMWTSVKDRIKCETNCLEVQEALEKQMEEDIKKKERMEAETSINKELDVLFTQYDKVSHMIADYCKKYENEDIYDKVTNRYIPRNFFDLIF